MHAQWQRDSRNSGQVGMDGENIFQVQGNGVITHGPQPESCPGRGRKQDQGVRSEDLHGLVPDQPPGFLSFTIIGIVIPCTQHECACHDPSLYFGTETFTP